MTRTPALAQLAQLTRQHHARADSDRLAIMEAPSVERYRTLLARVYAFEAAVEAACLTTPALDLVHARTHFKSQRLTGDLEALGIDAREVIPAPIPRPGNVDAALAWMWVVHRNTLLHGLLYRYLATQLGNTMQVAGAYLSVFEGRAGALMRSLGDALDVCSRDHRTLAVIASAGNDAFRHQRHWYEAPVRVRPRQVAAPSGFVPIPQANPMSDGSGVAHVPCSEERLPWTSHRRRSCA